jgi:hypothetical protein
VGARGSQGRSRGNRSLGATPLRRERAAQNRPASDRKWPMGRRSVANGCRLAVSERLREVRRSESERCCQRERVERAHPTELPRARSERTRSSRPRGRAPARNISPLLRSRLSPVKPAKSHHDPRLTTTLRGSVSKERPETIWKKLLCRPGNRSVLKGFPRTQVFAVPSHRARISARRTPAAGRAICASVTAFPRRVRRATRVMNCRWRNSFTFR